MENISLQETVVIPNYLGPTGCEKVELLIVPTTGTNTKSWTVKQGDVISLAAFVTPGNYDVIFKDGLNIIELSSSQVGSAWIGWNTRDASIGTHYLTAQIGADAECTSNMVAINVTPRSGTMQLPGYEWALGILALGVVYLIARSRK